MRTSAGAFVVCWTPGLVTLLLDGLLGKDSHANVYEKFCLVMAECNSLVNPVIYTLRDEEMARTFRWILCCLCGRTKGREVSPVQFAPVTPQVRVQTSRAPPRTFDRMTLALCSRMQETVDFVLKSEEDAAKSNNENSWSIGGL